MNTTSHPPPRQPSDSVAAPGQQPAETTAPFSGALPPATDESTTDPPPADTGASAWLVFTRGPRTGERVALGHTDTDLGRDRRCTLFLDDATVSRHHAVIDYDNEGHAITDTGSLNGTSLNRNPLDGRTHLTDGDEIQPGKFRLTFHTPPGT